MDTTYNTGTTGGDQQRTNSLTGQLTCSIDELDCCEGPAIQNTPGIVPLLFGPWQIHGIPWQTPRSLGRFSDIRKTAVIEIKGEVTLVTLRRCCLNDRVHTIISMRAIPLGSGAQTGCGLQKCHEANNMVPTTMDTT